jgi:hypothetical protein
MSQLAPYIRNLRNNDHAIARRIPINESGFEIPIPTRRNGEVMDGHLRPQASQKMGLSEVPVILCDKRLKVNSLSRLLTGSAGKAATAGTEDL